MALPNVSVLLQNGQIGGLIRFAEGVAGIIGSGVSVSGKIQLNTPETYFTLAEAEARGITAAENAAAHRHVSEFYAEAGEGAELHVMLVADTVRQATMLDVSQANMATKLLDYAQGRIRLLASYMEPDGNYTPVTTSGLEADVNTARTNAQALALAYAAAHKPLRIIIEGRGYQGNAITVPNLREATQNRVGVVIGGSRDDLTCSVGTVLGRLSRVPVMRKISRVKDGALTLTEAFVGTAAVEDVTSLGTLHDKGYITFRTIAGRQGYFISDDPTASPLTDDYNSIARGRVIDKAMVLAYLTYVNELNDEVPVNTNGKIAQGRLSYYEAIIANQINGSMTANGEISSVQVFIDPAQDVITTNKLIVVLRLVPVGYSQAIEVQLGFTNPLNT
jgi:hypothetical protein